MKNRIDIPYIPWRTVTTTPDRFWLPGGALTYEGSGAGSAYTSYVPGYSLPDGIASYARGVMPMPPNWGGRRMRALVAWRPANGSAGNVRFDCALRRIYDGGTISATIFDSVTAKVDASSGNTDVTVVTEFGESDWDGAGTAPTDIVKNEFVSFALSRRGDVGATDTYAYTIYLIAVELELV